MRHPPQPRINELYRSPERLCLDLNGPWKATLKELPDPGAAEDDDFDMTFQAPGCLEGQGLGLDIPPVTVEKPPHHGNIHGMQHGRQPGDPTFRLGFTIPGEWKDRRIYLGIGGVSGHCWVWLDGRPVPELNNPITAVGVQADLTQRECAAPSDRGSQVEGRRSGDCPATLALLGLSADFAAGRRVLLLAGPPPRKKGAKTRRGQNAPLPELPGMPRRSTAATAAPGCPSDWGPAPPPPGKHACSGFSSTVS